MSDARPVGPDPIGPVGAGPGDTAPDLDTVAAHLADASDPAARRRLEELLTADPAARGRYDRHVATLTATVALLGAEPAPELPAHLAASLDAALRTAGRERAAVPAGDPVGAAETPLHAGTPDTAPDAGTPIGPLAGATALRPRRRTWLAPIRRHAGALALAAAAVTSVVVTVPRLDDLGTTSSDSGAASSTSGAAASNPGAAASPAVGSAAGPSTPSPYGDGAAAAAATPPAGVLSGGRLSTYSLPAPGTVRAGAPAAGLADTGLQSVPAAPASTAPSSAPAADALAERTVAIGRVLADDPAAERIRCPDRGTKTTAVAVVDDAGLPGAGGTAGSRWLQATVDGATVLVEVTRTVCGPAEFTRTVAR